MNIGIQPIHRRRSGQILVEACIGLALVAFTWILISYSSFMTTNRIRTAMAVRHAAWRVAKDPAVSEQTLSAEINEDFFYNSFAVVHKNDNPVNHGSSKGMILLNAILVLHSHIQDTGPYRVNVSFGIAQSDLDKPDVSFPFNLMKTQVPFMPNSMIADVLSVKSDCQWAGIGDPWLNQPSDPQHGVLAPAYAYGRFLNQVFGWWDKLYTDAKWYTIDYPLCLLNCAAHPWRSCNCDEPPPQTFGCHP